MAELCDIDVAAVTTPPGSLKAALDPKGKGAWYFVSRWFCVLCGHSDEIRERRWDERPVDPADRQDYTEGACGVHFC